MTPALLILLTTLGGDPPVEAPLIPGAIPLEEPGRHESTRSFDDTVDFYRRIFRRTGGVRWRNIVNLPGVKAVHAQSLRRKTMWDGINIYEHRGKVRIFVLAKPEPPEDTGSNKKKRKKAKR